MSHFLKWRDFEGTQAEKFFKTTLWQGDHMMLGINCLEPGQSQTLHSHQGADKFYFVLEGHATFTVDDSTKEVEAGTIVIAPAGIAHGVSNSGSERLSVLVGIAPTLK